MAACVTALKRTHDLENYGQPYELSPKRQRTCSSRNSYSPKSNSLNIESLSLNNSGIRSSSPKNSEFPILKQIPKDEILKAVTSEAKNLKRRRELPNQKIITRPEVTKSVTGSSSSDSDSEISSSRKIYKKIARAAASTKQAASATTTGAAGTSAAAATGSAGVGPTGSGSATGSNVGLCKTETGSAKIGKKTAFSNPDTELRLTLRNVAMICETLLRQREDSIREEYDKVLHEKLQEQYEIWCRYNQDQLQQHKPSSSSNYIS
jgi:hypothetical protein